MFVCIVTVAVPIQLNHHAKDSTSPPKKQFPNNSPSFLKPVPAFVLCVFDTDSNGIGMNLGKNVRNPAAPLCVNLPFNEEATKTPNQTLNLSTPTTESNGRSESFFNMNTLKNSVTVVWLI